MSAWCNRHAWQNRSTNGCPACLEELQKERDAALCRASEATQECERLEARLENATALLRECRKWLKNPGRLLGYHQFRQRLDAAIGDRATYPYDERGEDEGSIGYDNESDAHG